MSFKSENQNHKRMTYKLKHVFCNNPECRVCAEGKGHGPYWHASYVINGRTYTVFLGKELKSYDIDSGANEEHNESQSTSFKKEEKAANKAENRFSFHKSMTGKKDQSQTKNTEFQKIRKMAAVPPSQKDFEKDLKMLKNTCRADSLKSLYRKLIKKYHPDQYPDIDYVNTWMAEINGCYDQHRKSLS